MVIVAAAMSGVGIVGDYLLKRASGLRPTPPATPAFLIGWRRNLTTAFAWVFVMNDP